MIVSDAGTSTLTVLSADAYLFGRFANQTPFSLITVEPDVVFRSGVPEWKQLVPSSVVDELMRHGLIASDSRTEKSRNHVLYITSKGRELILNAVVRKQEVVR